MGFGWLAFCILIPRLFALLIGPESAAAKFFVIIFIFILNIFWFYVFFHLTIFAFSYFPGNDYCAPKAKEGKVALLYTTCNDFQEEAALTHINQDYYDYHLFILDDSNSFDYQRRVDEFAKQFSEKVTVIRREKKTGFKAGNVNYGLRNIDRAYEYFSVSDN